MNTTPLSGRHPLRVDVSERLAEQLRQAANDEHRTVSGFVRATLVKAIEQRQPPAKDEQ